MVGGQDAEPSPSAGLSSTAGPSSAATGYGAGLSTGNTGLNTTTGGSSIWSAIPRRFTERNLDSNEKVSLEAVNELNARSPGRTD